LESPRFGDALRLRVELVRIPHADPVVTLQASQERVLRVFASRHGAGGVFRLSDGRPVDLAGNLGDVAGR